MPLKALQDRLSRMTKDWMEFKADFEIFKTRRQATSCGVLRTRSGKVAVLCISKLESSQAPIGIFKRFFNEFGAILV